MSDYKPPEAVQNAAKRGLELRRQYGRGGLSSQEAGKLGIGSGVVRATNLSNGDPVSEETIMKMWRYFQRFKNNHAENTQPDGGPSAGYIAWLLWGGDAGLRWITPIVKKLQSEKLEKQIALKLAGV